MLLILHTDRHKLQQVSKVDNPMLLILHTDRHKQQQVSMVGNPMLLILHKDSQAITLDTQTQTRTG